MMERKSSNVESWNGKLEEKDLANYVGDETWEEQMWKELMWMSMTAHPTLVDFSLLCWWVQKAIVV